LKRIDIRVKNLVKKYGTRDPEKIIRELGIRIKYKPYKDYTKGYYINAKTNKFIVINSNLNEHEQRIVLAHELGHAVLHSAKEVHYIREYTLFPRGTLENEANKFAAELLVCDDILSHYPDYFTVEQVASSENVHKRLLELKFNL
jgi:Zn-dependent peptidase ImmA (M78 family)